MPVFAVVTNPPMLGFWMAQRAKTIVASASMSIPVASRSAVRETVTSRVVPCIASDPVAVVETIFPREGSDERTIGFASEKVAVG